MVERPQHLAIMLCSARSAVQGIGDGESPSLNNLGLNMSIRLQCLCDYCGRDLSISRNRIDYRIAVQAERISSYNVLGANEAPPPIENSLHFCSLGCMREHFEPKWKREELRKHYATRSEE
jgi:hypothetical protein